MVKPQLRAEGIVWDGAKSRVLVQCDREESFYRFPGGGVEFGETAGEAIEREWMEEFSLPIHAGRLALVNESLIEYDGKRRHDCTLLHWCRLRDGIEVNGVLTHQEREDIRLMWKSLDELQDNVDTKPVYPEGILDLLRGSDRETQHHSIIRKAY